MTNPVAKAISIQLFIAAALLGVFGVANASMDGTSPLPSLLLAAACVGGAFAVRQGTPNGRLIGLVVSAGSVAYGVISLLQQHYLPGSIVATFALVRLATAGSAFTGAGPAMGPAVAYPQPSYGATPQYGQPAPQYGAAAPQNGPPAPPVDPNNPFAPPR
jgi:hypothetical protein